MQADQIIETSAYTVAVEFFAMLPRLGIALGLLALTWLAIVVANRALHRILKRTRMRRALAELMIEVADVGLWVVALFIAAAVAFPSVTPANIITGLGLGTVAIGFAFRDIFENFLAGILILYRERSGSATASSAPRSRASSRRSRRGTRTCARPTASGWCCPTRCCSRTRSGCGPTARSAAPPSSAGSGWMPTLPPRAGSSAARSSRSLP
jgi:hypothetical protein